MLVCQESSNPSRNFPVLTGRFYVVICQEFQKNKIPEKNSKEEKNLTLGEKPSLAGLLALPLLLMPLHYLI